MRDLLTLVGRAFEPFLAVLAVVAGAAFVVLGWRLFRHPASRAIGHTARDLTLACAVALIVALTLLTPTPIGSGLEPEPRLIPFIDLRDALRGDRGLGLVLAEIVGNVALFVPFGIALRWRFPWLGTLAVGLAALALSTTIEILQAVTGAGRWADSTDVITNTVGGLLGAVFAGFGTEAVRRD